MTLGRKFFAEGHLDFAYSVHAKGKGKTLISKNDYLTSSILPISKNDYLTLILPNVRSAQHDLPVFLC